ncbi:hypothetical protein, variant [Fonticula alba]|nr:hypothetical protein, variant [Fonticula alba]KCV67579.1 hypothetical protein, variant [Fonticula alba]|eukprot:XP_009498019.1 hypothetical protein, variant [Fonticula alba]
MAKKKSTVQERFARVQRQSKAQWTHIVSQANSSPELEKVAGAGAHLRFVNAITPDLMDACYNVIMTNMAPIYDKSNYKWTPASKRQEMRMDGSHYILVLSPHAALEGTTRPADAPEPPRVGDDYLVGLLAFCEERADYYPHTSDLECFLPPVNMLFCIELQVTPAFQGRGLGSFLLDFLTTRAATAGVTPPPADMPEKLAKSYFAAPDKPRSVRLLVQMANTPAMHFYRSKGFQLLNRSADDPVAEILDSSEPAEDIGLPLEKLFEHYMLDAFGYCPSTVSSLEFIKVVTPNRAT